jgi:hypothetical protein
VLFATVESDGMEGMRSKRGESKIMNEITMENYKFESQRKEK